MPTVLPPEGIFVSVKSRDAHHEAEVGLEFVISKLQRGPVSICPIAFVRVHRDPAGPSERMLRTGIGAGPDEINQQKTPNTTAPTRMHRERFIQPEKTVILRES